MSSVRPASAWPVLGVFFIEAAILGSLIPRIPDVKVKLGMSGLMLGICMLALSLGTIVAFLVAGRVSEKIGHRRMCLTFLPLWALALLIAGQVMTPSRLFVVLLLAGLAIGFCEVSMNMLADLYERYASRRIMSRCHGFWSLGSLAGAASGSFFAHYDFSVSQHFFYVMPVLAVAGVLVARSIPLQLEAESGGTEADAVKDDGASAAIFRLPPGALLMLCLMPMGAMAVEGAFIDWSALFMRDVLAAEPLVIGATYSFFSIVMATTRLCGDALIEKLGPVTVVRLSGIAASAGIGLFAISPTAPVAFAGAALAGLGVAIVYPISMTAAASRPGNAGDNVAGVALSAFTIFLLAPPLIGWLSDLIGLRLALGLLAPFAAVTAWLAAEAKPA